MWLFLRHSLAAHWQQVFDKVHQAQCEANEGGGEGCEGEELDQGANDWVTPGQQVKGILGSSRPHDVLQQDSVHYGLQDFMIDKTFTR